MSEQLAIKVGDSKRVTREPMRGFTEGVLRRVL